MNGNQPSRTAGLRRIVAFNWPKLAAASGLIAASAWAVGADRVPGAVALVALVVGTATAYFLVASLAASWWVYDRSDLHTWRWLGALLPAETTRWVLVHAGFDEAGPSLPAAIGPPDAVIDLSPRLEHVSPSLRRARRRDRTTSTRAADAELAWVPTGSCDAVVLAFAAHEVRDARQREALFDELHRVLKPTGRAILVEHLRDPANIAVFGPGAWHFQPRREWTRLAERAGFADIQEVKKTSFVHGLALCPC